MMKFLSFSTATVSTAFISLPASRLSPTHQPIVYSPKYNPPAELWPVNHTFPMSKFADTASHLLSILPNLNFIDVNMNLKVPNDLLHEPGYVARLLSGDLTKQERGKIGFRSDLVEVVLDRTLAEVQGTYLTAELALTYGLATNVAGGTHHARFGGGAGFTILNDLAITSAKLLQRHDHINKVLVVDLDVHQGDGTIEIAQHLKNEGLEGLYTFDFSCANNYPFDAERKDKGDYSFEFQQGVGDDEYLHTLADMLTDCLDELKPDFILFDAGVDVLESDSLGLLNLTMDGLRRRDFYVIQSAVERNIPVACVVGGGYRRVKAKDSEEEINAKRLDLAEAHSVIHLEAAKVWRGNNMHENNREKGKGKYGVGQTHSAFHQSSQ
ncbi:hypothetical protein ScalyP_jg2613 [Parmales sp. scaly parma]|nr:hypothetical protein ScalyP_jg2613 [Parmales sp. scaly parma]